VPHFYLLRHGQTADDLPGKEKVTGVLATPLNQEGRREIEKASRRLKAIGITSITASDVKRAQQSAEIVSGYLGIPVVESPRLESWDMGSLQGILHTSAKPFLHFFAKNYDVSVPLGERFQTFYLRWKSVWLATLKHVRMYPNSRPLLVTHSQNLDLCHWFLKGQGLGKPLDRHEQPPGSIMEIKVNDNDLKMRIING